MGAWGWRWESSARSVLVTCHFSSSPYQLFVDDRGGHGDPAPLSMQSGEGEGAFGWRQWGWEGRSDPCHQ